MKLGTFASVALAALTFAGCGDSLFTAQDRGDTILQLRGQALSAPEVPATEYDVGVLFVRRFWDMSGAGQDRFRENYVEFEFIKGTLTGSFPAEFQVKLPPPAETYPHNDADIYDFFGGHRLRMFPEGVGGVRVGHLVIGPKAELEALPPRLRRPPTGEYMELGPILRAQLPNTTVTAYQVLYSEGVRPDSFIYYVASPGMDGSDGFNGAKLEEGYMLIDNTALTRAVQWTQCVQSKQDEAIASPWYQNCIIDNPPNDCLLPAMRLVGEAACGPEVAPDGNMSKVLSPFDPLSVRLGEDDVKDAALILHTTYVKPSE